MSEQSSPCFVSDKKETVSLAISESYKTQQQKKRFSWVQMLKAVTKLLFYYLVRSQVMINRQNQLLRHHTVLKCPTGCRLNKVRGSGS